MPYNTAMRCCFSQMKTIPMPAAAALLALAGACVQDDAAGEAIFTPEVIGTAALPLSENEAVALLADERIACVVDSYETQVRCVDVEGAVVGVFGQQGGGSRRVWQPSLPRSRRGGDGWRP